MIGIVNTSVKELKKALNPTPKNVALADALNPISWLGPSTKINNVEVIYAKRIICRFE